MLITLNLILLPCGALHVQRACGTPNVSIDVVLRPKQRIVGCDQPSLFGPAVAPSSRRGQSNPLPPIFSALSWAEQPLEFANA